MATNESNPDDIRAMVAASYDSPGVAQEYLTASYESSGDKSLALRKLYVDKMLARLPPNSRILELGCGAGIPCTQHILEGGHTVTAVDVAPAQIELAKGNLETYLSPSPSAPPDSPPQLTLLCADMTTLSFPEGSFSAVVAFYSIVHLPKPDQQPMIDKMISWLKPGGLFLASVFEMPADGYYPDWLGHGGVKMFWTGFSAKENAEMVGREGKGMSIIDNHVSEENFREERTQVQWIFAAKAESEK